MEKGKFKPAKSRLPDDFLWIGFFRPSPGSLEGCNLRQEGSAEGKQRLLQPWSVEGCGDLPAPMGALHGESKEGKNLASLKLASMSSQGTKYRSAWIPGQPPRPSRWKELSKAARALEFTQKESPILSGTCGLTSALHEGQACAPGLEGPLQAAWGGSSPWSPLTSPSGTATLQTGREQGPERGRSQRWGRGW